MGNVETQRLLHHAGVAFETRRWDDAQRFYRQALATDPDHPEANGMLGEILFQSGQFDAARPILEKAVTCYRAAIRSKAIAQPGEYLGLGGALASLGHDAEAIAVFQQAADYWPRVDCQWQLASLLLRAGNLIEGFRHYELDVIWPYLAGVARWRGEPVAGKTVCLLFSEGYGDAIQLVRYAPLIAERGARVIMLVPQALVRLFRTMRGIEVYADESTIPPCDFCVQAFSLPVAFRTTIETIPNARPYLRAYATQWNTFLRNMRGLKVGLCWAGMGVNRIADNRRSMRLADMAPLLTIPGCSFVSLQLGPPAAQLRQLPPGRVHDVSRRLTDWADTAALIAGLDLVITVDTAVAHLAGALGKPVWMLNRFDSCWRWFTNRSDSPWYPTMRIFRQQRIGQWGSVIAEVADALASLSRSRVKTDDINGADTIMALTRDVGIDQFVEGSGNES